MVETICLKSELMIESSSLRGETELRCQATGVSRCRLEGSFVKHRSTVQFIAVSINFSDPKLKDPAMYLAILNSST
jgi:hypothetical protein